MADDYRFPVFFAYNEPLLKEQVKRIEKYFRVQRKSGGGECGSLRSVADQIYSVAFQNQRDQQEVLQRSEHVVDGVAFTVRDSIELCTSSPATSSAARQHVTAPVQSQQSIPAPTSPPSGEEYEKQLDSYLLRYLKECPEAWEALKRDLASVACSAQLYPEEGRVSVWSLAPNKVGKWKEEADKVFDGYLCHYEADPLEVKALLESCRSGQAADDVKVYTEVGMAVVVGERSQVNARLMQVEDSRVRRGSRLSERQIITHHVGKAKLRLLWGDIEQGLGRDFPGVKISQGNAGQLVLEGPVEEILKAGEWISGKESLVLERKVPDVSPHFLAFLKKAYGGPGMLCDFLGAGDEVEVELRDTELRFFSFSAVKLDDAEKNLQEKLKDIKILAPNSSAVPSAAQEMLRSRTDEMNKGLDKAQVVFGPDSTVFFQDQTSEVRAKQEACEHLLQGTNMGNSAPSDMRSQMDPASIRDTTGPSEDGVHLEIVHGTIESQQVDAVVSPMVVQDPLSTRVGNTLAQVAGSQLTTRYRMEADEDMFPGEAVLVDGLAGLPFNAVFFLNLIPWNDDEDGGAVEVLKLAINNMLTSCEKQGFGSVALPVLGSGMALGFPDSVVAKVLLKEVYAFGQNRLSRTPLSVSIVIHPDDDESHELFKSVQQDIFDIHQPDQASKPTRIVLLGKTGSGKSNLANTIFGETLFETNASANSGTSKCQAETRSVNGRSLTLIDTPGFFDAKKSEEELKPEIVRCITECAPGPHAFLIVLKVEKFTEHERAVIDKICQYFSEDALKYAVVVFTHGHDLKKGMKIKEFVSQNENLSKVVKMCGGRCHVVDNKHWNNQVQNNYRSNQLQVEELLKTIDKLVMDNDGGYYVNKMMEVVEKEIRIEEGKVRQLMGNLPVDEIRKEAKRRVSDRFLIQLAGTGTGALLGAFFGLAAMVGLVITALQNSMLMTFVKRMPAVGGAAALGGAEALTAIGVVAGVTTAGLAITGGAIGGSIGYNAAEEAETPWEAAEMAANAVINKGKTVLKM